MSEFEYYMKEDAFRLSHTTRHPHHQTCGNETTLAIERPVHKENRIVTKYYSKFDEFLMENGTSTEPTTTGKLDSPDVIPLKLPQEEVIAKLEAQCLSKQKKYDNWSNTTSVTYSVPSTFEVSVRDVLDSNFVQKVNPTMSMVDGQLYDRDYIYEKNPWGGDWRRVCPLKFPQPVLKNSQNAIDRRIVPLPISSLTSPCANNYTFKNNYWFRTDNGGEDKPHQGILKHDTPWSTDNSKRVLNELFVDLGRPQHITHIGTVGSFLPVSVYPSPNYADRRGGQGNAKKAHPDSHKYNRSIIVKEDPYHQTSWPMSYRLFYKTTPAEEYRFWGSYKANTNAYTLVVNDITVDAPSVGPVRYLKLMVVSSHPAYYHKKYTNFVNMSIAVYGRETPSPKPSVVGSSEAVTSAPAVIKYTISVPPARKNQVEVKQHRHNHFRAVGGGGGGGGASKHGGKQGLRMTAKEEEEEFRISPVGYLEEDHCYTSGEEQQQYCGYEEEELLEMPEDDSFWDPVIPYEEQGCVDMRVDQDENQWPSLPVVAKAPIAVVEDNTVAIVSETPSEVVASEFVSKEVAVVTVEQTVAVVSSESTDSEHNSLEGDTDSVKSDDDWTFV